jgi:hypothetical protein
MRISLLCDAAFHTPCGVIVVFPCSETGKDDMHWMSSNAAPGVSHSCSIGGGAEIAASAAAAAVASEETHDAGRFTLKHDTVLSSSFTRYAVRSVG